MADLVEKFYSADLSESEEEALDGLLASSPEAAGRFAQKAAEAYNRYGLPNRDSKPGRGPGWRGLGLWVLALVLMAGYGLWQTLWKVRPSGTTNLSGLHSNKPAPPVSEEAGLPASVVSPGEERTPSGKPPSPKLARAQAKRHSSAPLVKGSKTPAPVSVPHGATTVAQTVSSQGSISGSVPAAGLKNGPAWNPPAVGSGQANLRREMPPPQTTGLSAKGYSRLKIDLVIGQSGPVTVRILDTNGVGVKDLYSGLVTAGIHSFTWDGKLDNGKTAPPGKYQIESRNGTSVQTKDFWIQPKKRAEQ